MKEVSIDTRKRIVKIDSEIHELPKLEFDLLVYLYNQPGTVVTRDEILATIWGTPHVTERTIDVHVANLRRKVGNDKIITFRGVGYTWKEDGEDV